MDIQSISGYVFLFYNNIVLDINDVIRIINVNKTDYKNSKDNKCLIIIVT